jgi:hypothetical protein
MKAVSIGSGDGWREHEWDLVICSSGYESRSTTFAREAVVKSNRRVALGFREFTDNPVRLANDDWYKSNAFETLKASGQDEREAEDVFTSLFQSLPVRASVLVDISSMTRSWYGSLLRLLRTEAEQSHLKTVFVYTPSLFEPRVDGYPQNSVVGPVRGFCGLTLPSKESVLIAGLGHDPGRAMGLMQELDPAVAAAFVARPGTDPQFEAAVQAANEEYLREVRPEFVFDYPLRDFVATFHRLRAVTRAFARDAAPVLCPLGPKIFALSCFIVASVEPRASVWRVSAGPRERPVDRQGTWPPVVAEVEWQAAGDLVARSGV